MVYSILLILHNAMRWLVLVGLLAALVSAYSGWSGRRPYGSTDQALRTIATSIVHTQLLIGSYLYFISPLITYYWRFKPDAGQSPEFRFFSIIHILFMFTAVVIITIGSSVAKRKPTSLEKFRTTAIYFTLGLVLILIAIPWPFSPLASRGWFRSF